MPEALLEVTNLSARYGHIRAIEGINLRVEPGQITTLIGANGAGKTTTLKAIAGLLKEITGEIRLAGQLVQKRPTWELVTRGIIMSPEGRRVFPSLTVQENLLMGAYLRSDKAGVQEDLDRIYGRFPDLHQRRRQYAGTLSGGEQQMLAIGRAVMGRPRLLLLDEPSLGLAPRMVANIEEIIRGLNQEGISVLLVEQNARLAMNLATYAYVIETGRIALEGPAAELAQSDRVRQVYLAR